MTEPQIGLAGVVVVVIGIALGIVPWLTGCGTARELDHGELKQLLAMHAVRARVDEVRPGKDEIWIKYNAILEDEDEEAVFYARASWDAADAVDSAAAEPLVLPLEFHTAEEWEATPVPVWPVSIHDSPHWHELQLRWVESMTPAESGHGVVVRSERDELLYYRDADGKVNLTVLEEKPESVRVVKVYGPRELRPLILSLLDENLDQFGVNERRVLFETGRYGPGAAIVLYADLDARRVFLLRLQGESAAEISSLNLAAKVGGHLIARSTAASFLSNPFSTLNRLLFLTGNNVYDLTRPSKYLPESSAEVPPLSTGPPMDTAVFEEELDGLTGTALEMGSLRLLIDGDGFFPRFLEAVLDAESSVDLRIFIFDTDDYARKVADVLRRKSGEVEVRVLLDGVGSAMAGGLVRDYLRRDSNVKARVQKSPMLMADHSKSILIDRDFAFVGGMNIGQQYRYEWHDLMAEVRGPVVDVIQKEFDKRWSISGLFGDFSYFFHRLTTWTRSASTEGEFYPVRVLCTRPGESAIYRAQRAATAAARRYIYLQNPYFADNLFIREVIAARRRGVDVRVMLPFEGNHGVMNRSNVVTSNLLFRNGVRVYLYPGMSHVKAAVFDGWACFGSANFDWLSMRRNLELNLATSHAPAVEDLLDKIFDRDFEKSIEMTEPFPENWSNYLARIMASRL